MRNVGGNASSALTSTSAVACHPARYAPTSAIRGGQRDGGKGGGKCRCELQQGEQSEEPIGPPEQWRGGIASKRESKQHGREHRREREGRGGHEVDQHAEPHDFERERGKAG